MTRPLKAADFGAKASSFKALVGTLRIEGDVATVTVRYIQGAVGVN